MDSIIKEDLLDFIKKENVDMNNISAIKACFDMLEESLTGLKSNLSNNLPKLSIDNNYERMEEYIQHFKEIDKYLCLIQDTKQSIQTALPQPTPTISRITVPDSISNPSENLKEVHTIFFRIIDDETTTCPVCEKELTANETTYWVFYDRDHLKYKAKQRTHTKLCPSCNELFIKRVDFQQIQNFTGVAYTNIVCKKIETKKVTCSYWDCQSTEIYRDGLCKDHYNYEHYESK